MTNEQTDSATSRVFSVIIVNFNGGTYLQSAIDSLKSQKFQRFEVIVIDNASDDESARSLDLEGLPSAKLLMQSENHGFARGNNIAVKQARSPWIVLLNPDAVADPNWLLEIHRAIQRYPRTSMFASCQYSLEAPHLLDGVGDAYLAYGFPWRGGYGRSIEEIPEEGQVFGPCGASAVYRRDLFESIGGFEESFFCYCEDVDLAFRLRLSGENCVFLPTAIISHAGSAIAGKSSEFTIFHGNRNRIWLYFRNMPLQILLLTIPFHLVLTLYLLVRTSFTSRRRITWQAVQEGYKRAASMRKDAVHYRKLRKASLINVMKAMTWNPWRMSRHCPDVRST